MMDWALQAAEIAPFSWGQFLGSSGPLAGAALLLGYLAKIYIDSRKEKRADRKAGIEGEVGAVAAARDAVALVRDQMNEMKEDIAGLRSRAEEDRKLIDKLERRVRELENENSYLKGHQK